MSRRLLAVTFLPPLIGALVAGIVKWILKEDQTLFFAISFGLTVPAGVVAFLFQEWLVRRSPFGMVAALAVGTAIRLVVCFGGGVAVFLLLKPEERSDKLAFWFWILFAYLTALAVEVAVFAKKR